MEMEGLMAGQEAYRSPGLRLTALRRGAACGDGSKMHSMSASVKDEVLKLAAKLPLDVTWDQVMYEIYVRQKIEEGERAVAEGRTTSHEDVRKRFGLA